MHANSTKPQTGDKPLAQEARHALLRALAGKLRESVRSVLPVSAIVLALALTPLVDFTPAHLGVFVACSLGLVLGIGLFNMGADLAMTPMGQHIGTGLTKSRKLQVLLPVCFAMGALITVAEPDLQVLAGQVGSVMDGKLLLLTVGAGVGLLLVFAVMKILFHNDLSSMLLFFYMALFAAAAILLETGRGAFIPMCFDSGGVTTGPVTVPFIMALGVGIALTVGGRHASENSFGLIALCSVGPILAVLVLSTGATGDLSYTPGDYSMDAVLEAGVGHLLWEVAKDVGVSLLLLAAFFLVLQFTVLHLPARMLRQIAIGLAYTFVGLVVFLASVALGFMPVGYGIGRQMAGSSPTALIVCSFIVGMVVVLAEPAVHVLKGQVEQITGGEVGKTQMTLALSIGVGVSIGLSLIRIRFGFPLLYYLVPGYLLSLGLSFFVPKLYTAIAFDSGGVASGPLTSSFILPMAIGACATLQGDAQVLSYAFGIVAMVAMTPLITIQCLGFRSVLMVKARRDAAMKRIQKAGDDQIIYFD